MQITNIEDVYPLSPLQQGMLFHTLYTPEAAVYFDQIIWSLQGKLDIDAYHRAWQQLVERHSILRAAFVWEDLDEPLQVIRRRANLTWEQQDWRGLPPSTRERRLEQHLEDDLKRPFQLNRAPLMRCALIQMEDDLYRFIWSYHHLLLDGWSLPLVIRNVYELYESNCQGTEAPPNRSRDYRNYISWLQSQDAAKAEAFWRKMLKGFAAPTSIPGNIPGKGPSRRTEHYAKSIFPLSQNRAVELSSFARQNRLTVNTLVHGAWAILLSQYSGEQDVVFGTIVSGRPPDLTGVESMIGLFINTLPVRAQVSPDSGFLLWLEDLQHQQVEMRQYEYSSLLQIQGCSEIRRSLPLFESILIFENTPTSGSSRKRATNLDVLSASHREARTGYPLTLMVLPGPEMSFHITYDSSRFDAAFIDGMGEYLLNLLEGMTRNPKLLSELPLLAGARQGEEIAQLADDNNSHLEGALIHQLFEAQVERTPGATAVLFEDKSLTYVELDRRANQLAHHLRALGVGPERLVGIALDRGLDMLIAVLGVLKAGGAYLPLDITHPRERLGLMIGDSAPVVLLTERALLDTLPKHSGETLCIDTDSHAISCESNRHCLTSTVGSNLAYVIYTSGSTGKPKGVQVSHRNVVNLLQYMSARGIVSGDDCLLAVTTISFDIAALELLLPLLVGARLVIAKHEDALDGARLIKKLSSANITVMQATPSTWRLLIDSGWRGDKRLTVLCGGEALTRDLANRLAQSNKAVWNLYGPTETTIWSTIHRVESGTTAVPIGGPMANTQIYILNRNSQPVPIGIPGELYIGGDGVARGYLNQPDLTAERFLPDQFATRPGSRLYRTGDQVRYVSGGDILFTGRTDHQVKLRGHRIELGEIEAALDSHEDVQQAVVLCREDEKGEKRLIAYVVAKNDLTPDTDQLAAFLRRTLPQFMIPATLIFLDSFPLTPNNKIDRRALPEPDNLRPKLSEDFIAPRNPIEKSVAEIVAQVLRIDRAGINDNFFDLGGHSLLATQITSKLREALQIEVSLQAIFDYPTIGELSAVIEVMKNSGSSLRTPPIQRSARRASEP